jgi:diaminopimelate decarboxylase
MDKVDLFPVTAEISDGHISHIGGVDLVQLAELHGTPLYLYDAATVNGNYKNLRKYLDQQYQGRSQIAYASKAYLSLKFAHKMAGLQSAIDVVSFGELEIALSAGFPADKIHLHGNNKSEKEIRLAISKHIESIVVDSLDELQFVEAISKEMGQVPRIWLRINPDIAVDTHKAVQTGHGASKFGIPADNGKALHAIQSARESKYLTLTGIHTHLGSQIFEAKQFSRAIDALLGLCKEAGWHPDIISPGGGWGIPYTEESTQNDPEAWVQAISKAVQNWCTRENLPLPELIIEPGRWLVARAGVALYRVGATKETRDGEWVAAVDGGMADNPRVALYGSQYTAELVGSANDRPIVKTRLVGRFCESGDELIHHIMMPRLQRGDLVAIPVSGAYQVSMASNYNLADRPCVLWLEDGKVEILQNRELASQTAWWLGD